MRASSKVVGVLHGGVGNQLFIWASAHALASRTGAALVLDSRTRFQGDRFVRQLAIHKLGATWREAGYWERRLFSSRTLRGLLRICARRFGAASGLLVESVLPDLALDRLACRRKTIVMDGYWQRFHNFSAYSLPIKNTLTRGLETLEVNDTLLHRIRSSDSICVHMRTMYFESPGKNSSPDKLRQISRQYYREAIGRASSALRDPHVFLFADNPQFAARYLDLDVPHTVCSSEVSEWADLREMKLMAAAKHFVISNSSFAWWAAWLGANPAKNVYYPNRTEWRWKRNPAMFPSEWQEIQ